MPFVPRRSAALLDRFPWIAAEAAQADARRLVMVRGLIAYPALMQRVTRPDGRIAWLTALLEAQSPERLVRASPYFWFHLRKAFAVLSMKGPTAALDTSLNGVALAALDSFAGRRAGFPRAPFAIPSLDNVQLIRTGVSFGANANIDTVEVHAGSLTFHAANGSRVGVSIAPHASDPARSLPLRRIEDASIDLGRSDHQIERDEAAIETLAPKLEQALAWIDNASPAIAALVASQIQILVPLRQNATTQFSFTLSNLPGLLFVGGSDRLLPIVEAIVHETGHARLHHANEIHPLAHGEQREEYYSPWRNDPRPATGVLHGAYVFALVLAFWIEALDRSGSTLGAEDEAYIRSRIALVTVQLREAVDVLGKADLTPFSQNILGQIRAMLPVAAPPHITAVDMEAALRAAVAKRVKAAADFPSLILPTS